MLSGKWVFRGLHEPLTLKKESVAYATALAIFLIIKLSSLAYKFSDENTYFYMAKLVTEGILPYRDFFFASPPLQVFLMTPPILLIGEQVLLLKLIPIFATAVTSYLIYLIAERQFGSREALIASALYLFSFLVLTTTDHSTGVHLSSLFITAMLYFVYKDRPLTAGLMGSLSLLTRLYAIFPVAGITAYLLFLDRKRSLKFLLGSAVLFLTVSALMQYISHGRYLEQIFLLRMGMASLLGIPKSRILWFFARWDTLLIVSSTFFVFTKNKRQYALPVMATLFLMVFYAAYRDLYYLYLALIIPFLSLFTAHSIMHFGERRHFNKIIAVLLLALVVHNTFFYLKDHADASKITFIDDIVSFVSSNSEPSDTLYGSFEITPLISLLSGRRITHNFVDTNDKIFMTGIASAKERTSQMRDDIKFIIGKVTLINGFVTDIGAFADLEFLSTCQTVRIYPIEKDYFSDAVIVWDCSANHPK